MAGADYSMGFALSFDGEHILLLHKNRPDYLAGAACWSGGAY